MMPRTNMLPLHIGRLSSAVLALLLVSAPELASAAARSSKSSTPPPPTRWAIVPLVVVGGEGKEAKQFQSAFESEVSKSGIDRANPKLVTGFLSQESTCIRKDDCLSKLAKAVNSERTLLVTISPFAKEVVLTMKVIGSNGGVINESASTVNHGPNETVLAASKDSFQVLLSDLQTEPAPLGNPEPTKPPVTQIEPKSQPNVVTTPNPATTKPPLASTGTPPVTPPLTPRVATVPAAALPPPTVVAASPGSWKTPVGIGVGAVGVVGIGLGTLFLIQGNNTWAQEELHYANGSLPIPGTEDYNEVKRLTASARSQQTLAVVSYAVGAAAILGGGFLILTDDRRPSGSRVSAHLAVTPNSGTLVIQFP